MKPKKLPRRLEGVWPEWPTLDTLHERDKTIKLHVLRAMLQPVPCYRCEDNSVRYDPEIAELALTGRLPGQDDDAGEDDRESDLTGELQGNRLDGVMVLCRELGRMVTDARREKNEHIKVMETPMRIGVSMMEQAMAVMAKRLEHYDEMWDEMIATAERLQSHDADRQLAATQAERSHEARRDVFAFAKSQLPALISNVKQTAEAKAALDLLRSIPEELVDGLLAEDAAEGPSLFTADQKRLLRLARGGTRQKPPQQQSNDQSANHAAPNHGAS